MTEASAPERSIRLVRPTTIDGVGVFCVRLGRTTTFYTLLEIPCAIGGRGFEVLDTGSDTPASSFVDTAAQASRLRAVVIGSSTSDREEPMRRTIQALRDADIDAPILVGGIAVADQDAARSRGADGWTGHGAREALATVEQITA